MTSPVNLESITTRADQLERIGKGAAWLIPLIYALGFLVVSLHLSRYGISHFEFVRPQVLAAGMTLVGITALGWITGTVVSGQKQLPLELNPEGYLEYFEFASRLALVVTSGAFFLAAYIYQPRTGPLEWLWKEHGPVLVGLLLLGLAELLKRKLRPGLRWIVAIVLTASTVLILLDPILIIPRGRALSLYLFLIALVPVLRSKVAIVYPGDHDRHFRLFGLAAMLLGLYATRIYPEIKPSWGGGAPVIAMVSIADGDSERTEEVRVIEETSAGYYFLVDDPKAGTLFMPRAAVRSILIPLAGQAAQRDPKN